MRRDFELLRRIMLAVEAAPYGEPVRGDYPAFHSEDKAALTYHMAMLLDAGLAMGSKSDADWPPRKVTLTRLSWQGHELIDALRDESVMAKLRDAHEGKQERTWPLEVWLKLAVEILLDWGKKQVLGSA